MTKRRTKAIPGKAADGAAFIRAILSASDPRPTSTASQAEKNQYAVRFAQHAANRIAADLSTRLPGVTATTKRTARSVHGQKQLDVNFSTPELGLALGISLKSVHVREIRKRYTHNMKRNEEELRVEASGYHKRQPYAVLVGVLFLPFDSCDDAKKNNPSSFGSWVRHLRPYAGRSGPGDEIDRFEKIYIALYEPDGSDLRFFDVEADPPKNGRPPKEGDLGGYALPRRLLSYGDFLDSCYRAHLWRNSAEFKWSDGEEEPIEINEGEEDEAAET